MTTRTLPIIIAIVLPLGLMAGCGDDDTSTAAGNDATAPEMSERAETPYGTYVRTVTKQDLARTAAIRDEHGPHQELPPSGDYQLVIAKGAGQDVIKATAPDGFTIDQDIVASGDVIRLTSYVDPSVASFCGPEVPAQAQYAFDARGGTLELSPDPTDPCADRDSILTGTWRQG